MSSFLDDDLEAQSRKSEKPALESDSAYSVEENELEHVVGNLEGPISEDPTIKVDGQPKEITVAGPEASVDPKEITTVDPSCCLVLVGDGIATVAASSYQGGSTELERVKNEGLNELAAQGCSGELVLEDSASLSKVQDRFLQLLGIRTKKPVVPHTLHILPCVNLR